MTATHHFDIIIGTGAGGETLAHHLAHTGKKILLIERGTYLSCDKENRTSVLDLNCKAHDQDNLYVVDGGFFVSSSAVNPTLTIIANALRVGDHLLERIK